MDQADTALATSATPRPQKDTMIENLLGNLVGPSGISSIEPRQQRENSCPITAARDARQYNLD
jgi:hypothetical protein